MSTVKQTNKTKGEGATGKLSLNLTKPVIQYANSRAKQQFDGNLSMYVRKLIQQDKDKEKAAA